MVPPPKSYPAVLPALATAAVSFGAHPRPLSLPPPVPLSDQCPRRTAAAALGMAIPPLPLFPGTRNPKFHQPGETEGLLSRSRPGSRTGALPVASRGGPGGRERAEASVGPGLLRGDIPGDPPRTSTSCFVKFFPTFSRLMQRTEARSEAPSGTAARSPPCCLPGTPPPPPVGPPLAGWLLLGSFTEEVRYLYIDRYNYILFCCLCV